MAFHLAASARRDLWEILDYIFGDSGESAARFEARFIRSFSMLAQNPFLGRSRDEVAPGYRSVVVGRYVVFYLATGEDVEIVRVLHGRRDLSAVL